MLHMVGNKGSVLSLCTVTALRVLIPLQITELSVVNVNAWVPKREKTHEHV